MNKKYNIKYIRSGSVFGEHFHMIVNGDSHACYIGDWRYEGKLGDEIDHAIYILKSEYGIVRVRRQIVFEWDGTL